MAAVEKLSTCSVSSGSRSMDQREPLERKLSSSSFWLSCRVRLRRRDSVVTMGSISSSRRTACGTALLRGSVLIGAVGTRPLLRRGAARLHLWEGDFGLDLATGLRARRGPGLRARLGAGIGCGRGRGAGSPYRHRAPIRVPARAPHSAGPPGAWRRARRPPRVREPHPAGDPDRSGWVLDGEALPGHHRADDLHAVSGVGWALAPELVVGGFGPRGCRGSSLGHAVGFSRRPDIGLFPGRNLRLDRSIGLSIGSDLGWHFGPTFHRRRHLHRGRLRRRLVLVGQQLGGELLGCGRIDPVQSLTAGGLGGQSGVVLGREQVGGDGVDRSPHIVDGLGQSLPTGPELLDLHMQYLAALGQVGQHPGPQALGLLHHGPALLPRLLQHGVGLAAGLLHGGGGLLLDPLLQFGGRGLDGRRTSRPAGPRCGLGSVGSPHDPR